MRPRLLTLIAGTAMVLSACSGATPTQSPTATTQAPGQTADTGGGDGSGPTDAPDATGGSGGGGITGTGSGTVHIEISGPVSKAGDYAFAPAGSLFGGAQGSSLSFTNDQTNEIVSILISADNKVVVSYGGPDLTVPGAECTTSDWNMTATSGSGSFDCTATLIITAAGAQLTGGKIKGTFTAHA
jgi:hypothetical protein